MSLRFHFEFASMSLRFHFHFTSVHFDFTSISLRLHFDFTSILRRFQLDVTNQRNETKQFPGGTQPPTSDSMLTPRRRCHGERRPPLRRHRWPAPCAGARGPRHAPALGAGRWRAGAGEPALGAGAAHRRTLGVAAAESTGRPGAGRQPHVCFCFPGRFKETVIAQV